ncbi:MAG: RNA 2',3'-cyclic phosphodiesterase, partial [Clostridia bacterium]|nr:RNA 2',3'-cyclic phosphodiesterase [Clostridia bacterium]
MRLFTAIQPSPGFRAALEDLQQRLREAGVTGKYREADGLHLTLAFIGEWPEDITELLPVVRKPFSVTLSHLGIFPEANVLWAGVDPCEELDLLAKQVRHRL